ncbi:unnamed protein product [Cunninghamella echinulata]
MIAKEDMLDPNMEETFIMVIGETKGPLCKGFIILANCVLDSDSEGPIYAYNDP